MPPSSSLMKPIRLVSGDDSVYPTCVDRYVTRSTLIKELGRGGETLQRHTASVAYIVKIKK
jgi:hypothetical protein